MEPPRYGAPAQLANLKYQFPPLSKWVRTSNDHITIIHELSFEVAVKIGEIKFSSTLPNRQKPPLFNRNGNLIPPNHNPLIICFGRPDYMDEKCGALNLKSRCMNLLVGRIVEPE